jgi:hypothetical protein
MVFFNQPTTITRVARFNGDLEKTIDSFNFTNEVIKKTPKSMILGLYEITPHPYLLLIANQRDTPNKLNLLLSITSYYPQMNKNIFERLEKETGIISKEPSREIYEDQFDIGIDLFEMFQEYGTEAFNQLRIAQKTL